MNPIEQLIAKGYLVIPRETVRRYLSDQTYQELIRLMEQSLREEAVSPLSEEESRSMEKFFSDRMNSEKRNCPLCGSTLIHQGGCLECSNPSCGWAACG